MRIKYFALLLEFTLFVLCLGCSDISKQTNVGKTFEGDSVITLNWIGHWQNREGKEQMVKDVAREFEFNNQGCRVNMKFPAEIAKSTSYRSYLAKLYVEMIETGNVQWDIIFLDHYLYDDVSRQLNDPFWGSKYLVDFEKLDWFKERHKAFIYEEPLYRNGTGGTLIGPFTEGYYSGLWYDRKNAEKIGIDVKLSEMSFEDFKGYLKKGYEYNQKNAKKVVLLGSGGDLDDPVTIFNAIVVSHLSRIDTNAVVENLAAVRKGLEAMEELAEYKPLEKYGMKADQELLLRGNGLFLVLSTWLYNKWAKLDSAKIHDLAIAELPVLGKDGPAYQGTYQSVFAVFNKAPHKELALQLLKYMSSQDVGEKWLSTTKNPTGLKTQLNATELMQDEIDVFNYKIDKKFGKNFYNCSLFHLLFGVQNKAARISIIDLLDGRITADEAYNMVVKQLKVRK
jgi:ABC-type glycerol-3-phosphate transport system substrate-binding protein